MGYVGLMHWSLKCHTNALLHKRTQGVFNTPNVKDRSILVNCKKQLCLGFCRQPSGVSCVLLVKELCRMAKRILRYIVVLTVLWVIHLQHTTIELKLLAALGHAESQEILAARAVVESDELQASQATDECYWTCNAGKAIPVQNGACLMPPKPPGFCKKFTDKW